jgi:para-nitrobenzyl esterase
MQSGSGTAAFTPEQAAIVREAAAKALGVPPTLEGFAGLTDEELLAATPALMGLDLGTTRARDPLQKVTPLGVVLDEQPAVAAARGLTRPVDLLIGHNTEEGNLYLLPNGTMATTTPSELSSAAHYAHPDPDRLLSLYRARHPDATPGRLRSIILGEAAFGAGSRALADAHAAAGHCTYAYVFNWRSTALAGQLGATHIVEAPFTFNTLSPELHGAGKLLGPAPAPQSLADQTHGAWTEFIKTGTPGWPRYEPDQRTTMTIGDEWVPVSDPFAQERAAWTIT